MLNLTLHVIKSDKKATNRPKVAIAEVGRANKWKLLIPGE